MSTRPIAATLAILALGAVASLAAPGGAGAAVKTRLATKTVQVPPDVVRTAIAKCPRGWLAAAGGFQASPPALAPGQSLLIVHASHRTKPRRWIAAAKNVGAARGTLTAFAYCRRVRGGLAVRTRQRSVAPFNDASMTLTCPRGTRAIGGGFRTRPANFVAPPVAAVLPWESRRVGTRSWKLTATSSAGNTTAKPLRAYAYCGAAKAGVARRAASDLGPSGAVADAPCPPRTRPLAGGFRSRRTDDSSALVYENVRIPGRTWRVVAFQGGSGTPAGRLTSFAYCG